MGGKPSKQTPADRRLKENRMPPRGMPSPAQMPKSPAKSMPPRRGGRSR